MDNTRLERIGAMFAQVADLMMSDAPLNERLMAFVVLTGQISAEYGAQESEARQEAANEARADGWNDGWNAGYASGSQVGYLSGLEVGSVQGRQEAQREVEQAITGEPVTMDEADAAAPALDTQSGEAVEADPKAVVH